LLLQKIAWRLPPDRRRKNRLTVVNARPGERRILLGRRHALVARPVRAFVFLLALAACASAPTPSREGEEELSVTGMVRVPALDPLTATPTPAGFAEEPLDGVSCTLRNDKGAWNAITPAKVRVPRSSSPLEIECAKEGFRTRRWKLRCLTPQERENKTARDVDLALSILAIPAGILTAPVGGASLVVQGAMGVGEHAYTSSRPPICSYGPVIALLHPVSE
jgi:hypothetical protein